MRAHSFRIAAGTMVGRDHVGAPGLLVGKNNQDAHLWLDTDDYILAVVCDGCGSKPHSEVGAKLGARLLLNAAARRLARLPTTWSAAMREGFWEGVRGDLLAQLRVLALQMAGNGSFSAVVDQYFLFTTVALLVTNSETQVAAVGDGVWAVNGTIGRMGPYPDNKPPYVAYDMVHSDFSERPELLRFEIASVLPTAELDSALIGSDGVNELVARAERRLPGREEVVGPIEQFWSNDRFFKNSDNVRRRLALINSAQMYLDPHKRVVSEDGLLADDTTLVVVSRDKKGGDS